MNIYNIAQLTKETAPYFFDKDTLKFFHQTMSGFKVKKVGERWQIWQPMKDSRGRNMGMTIRYFNPINNELERE